MLEMMRAGSNYARKVDIEHFMSLPLDDGIAHLDKVTASFTPAETFQWLNGFFFILARRIYDESKKKIAELENDAASWKRLCEQARLKEGPSTKCPACGGKGGCHSSCTYGE
jgi:hypothetical protein